MNKQLKLVTLASLGTILEWAEFTFYAYMASTISILFFPSENHNIALIATFGIFAIGYFMRPLGAIIFGHTGDRIGRLKTLQWSILLMGISAIFIGCLPTYAVIGIWAPLLLLLFRCLQGLAVSGEFNGSSIFLMEHANKNKHLAASWTGWAAAIGMMLGSLAATIVSLQHMPAWAWRIPFLSGALVCTLGVYFRRKLAETPEFLNLIENKKRVALPIQSVLKKFPTQFIFTMTLAACFGIYIYVGNIFYVTYLSQVAHLAAYQTKLVVTIGSLLVMCFIPITAKCADRYNGKNIIKIGFLFISIAGPLLFLFAQSKSFALILLGQLIYAIADAMVGGPIFKFLNDLFPASVRYTGVSFAWSVSMAIFAGTAALVSMYLQHWTHFSIAPAFYIALAGLIGFASLSLLPTTETEQGIDYDATKALES